MTFPSFSYISVLSCAFKQDGSIVVHANDVYHRYITNDITLAIEVAENTASQAITTTAGGEIPSGEVQTPVESIAQRVFEQLEAQSQQVYLGSA